MGKIGTLLFCENFSFSSQMTRGARKQKFYC
jgi:hypothetical protein